VRVLFIQLHSFTLHTSQREEFRVSKSHLRDGFAGRSRQLAATPRRIVRASFREAPAPTHKPPKHQASIFYMPSGDRPAATGCGCLVALVALRRLSPDGLWRAAAGGRRTAVRSALCIRALRAWQRGISDLTSSRASIRTASCFGFGWPLVEVERHRCRPPSQT
jgi:hypothetical protein